MMAEGRCMVAPLRPDPQANPALTRPGRRRRPVTPTQFPITLGEGAERNILFPAHMGSTTRLRSRCLISGNEPVIITGGSAARVPGDS